MFFVLKNVNSITITPISPAKPSQSNAISIVMNQLPPQPKVVKQEIPIVKKEVKPLEQKVVKKIVKKVAPLQKVQESVVEKVAVLTQEVKTPVVQTPSVATLATPTEATPAPKESVVFDADMKAEYIAGLYSILNENKHYPKMAKRRHLEGVTYIHFTLLKNGKVQNVFIQTACGHKSLDNAALELVQNIKAYKPIPDEVSRIALNLKIPITYSLKENY
jgi:protein TonB